MKLKDLKNSTKCLICDNDYVDNDVKVRIHCHINRKYRDSAHRDCNINLKLNQKIIVKFIFHYLKTYDSHLIIQELCKFSLKINVISNGIYYITQNKNQNIYLDANNSYDYAMNKYTTTTFIIF